MPPRPFTQVSPSQIKNYDQCPRVWYNASILGDRAPQKGNQTKGEGIHKALEVYLETGEVLPIVELPDAQNGGAMTAVHTLEYVQVAQKHIPKPITDTEFWAPLKAEGSGLMLEQPGEMGTYEGGPFFIQYIDLVEAYLSRAKITDYKTTSNFRYAKTPEELAEDVQLNANARWLFSKSDYTEIEIGHLYLLTANVHPKIKPVYTTVTREQNAKIWERDMAKVREMQNWAKLAPPTAESLPPNTESCDMYGGCYYRTKCGFSPDSKPLFQIRRTNTMADATTPAAGPAAGSLLARMMQAKTGATASTPAAAAATPAPAAPAAASAPSSGTSALFSRGPAATAPASAPVSAPVAPTAPTETKPAEAAPASAPVSGSAPAATATPPGLASLFGKGKAATAPAAAPVTPPAAATGPAVGLTPPDAPPATSTAEEVAAANKETPADATAPETAAAAVPESSTPAGDAPAAPEGEAAKAKRTRRTKAQIEADEKAAAESVAKPESTPATEAPAAPATGPSFFEAAKAAAPGPADRAAANSAVDALRAQFAGDPSFECPVQVLFIDCHPMKGWPGEAPVSLTEFMAAIERAAASSSGALDYRMIKYGEGAGWLATATKVMMKAFPSALVIDSRIPGAAIVESVLTPYVKAIFRGSR